MANKAAWLTAAKAKPFKVDDAPMPVPQADEVVIRNRAVAINPCDWAMQTLGLLPLPYPFIEGCDAAGEITSVGSAVEDFEIGDRVVAILDPYGSQNTFNGAFQLFAVTKKNSIAKLPDTISYVEASVLPLGISTAAVGLFQTDTLALPHPQINPKPTSKVVLVWGGSSSVGACAIQLIAGAGFEVATTASSHNLEYCKTLGARYVFDYTKDSVVEEIVTTLNGIEFGGVFCAIIDSAVVKSCAHIADKLGGNKFVSTVLVDTMPLPDDLPSDVKTSKVLWGTSLLQNEVGPAVWGKWIPAALANGSLKCAPPPLVVGQGLEAIQDACERWKSGVSCRKVVVELP